MILFITFIFSRASLGSLLNCSLSAFSVQHTDDNVNSGHAEMRQANTQQQRKIRRIKKKKKNAHTTYSAQEQGEKNEACCIHMLIIIEMKFARLYANCAGEGYVILLSTKSGARVKRIVARRIGS